MQVALSAMCCKMRATDAKGTTHGTLMNKDSREVRLRRTFPDGTSDTVFLTIPDTFTVRRA